MHSPAPGDLSCDACSAAWSAVLAPLCRCAGWARPSPPTPSRCMASRRCRPISRTFPTPIPMRRRAGAINYAWPGTFDSINPFIVQGSGARGSIDLVFGNNVFETLMMRSADEPFTLYPLLAKTVETDDRAQLRRVHARRARQILRRPAGHAGRCDLHARAASRQGPAALRRRPPARSPGWRRSASAACVSPSRRPDRELPLILGLLPILPKHAIDAETFDKSTLKPMIGSGPYRLESVRAGESLTFRRNPDYWAKDIPSKRGFDNYDKITLTYYRDENAMFEAFKKGLVDVFIEENSGRWASGNTISRR